jgi:hypothetical protein
VNKKLIIHYMVCKSLTYYTNVGFVLSLVGSYQSFLKQDINSDFISVLRAANLVVFRDQTRNKYKTAECKTEGNGRAHSYLKSLFLPNHRILTKASVKSDTCSGLFWTALWRVLFSVWQWYFSSK